MPRDQDLRHPGGAQLRWRPTEVRDEGDAGQWEARHEVTILQLDTSKCINTGKFTRPISIWWPRRRKCPGGPWRRTGTWPGGSQWGWRYSASPQPKRWGAIEWKKYFYIHSIKAEKKDDAEKTDNANDTEADVENQGGQSEAVKRRRAKSLSNLVFQAKKWFKPVHSSCLSNPF